MQNFAIMTSVSLNCTIMKTLKKREDIKKW